MKFAILTFVFLRKMDDTSSAGIEECTQPLLKPTASRNKWKMKASPVKEKMFFFRVSILILLWTFSTGLLFNLFIKPYNFLQNSSLSNAAVLAVVISSVFLLSPLAGFIADVKFGRLKVLLCGSFTMLLSVCSILIVGIVLAISSHSFNTTGKMIMAAFAISFFFYGFGEILYLANIVQFGTDQLCNAPTRYSVYFICAYYWTDSFGQLLTAATNIPGHEIVINKNYNIIAIDTLRGSLIGSILFISISLSSIVQYFICKKKSRWFIFEKCTQNPYMLVYKVVYFAINHKKPIRRSAFTFCENERLSRLDFGKQRYGGPFTTEQVEDVKVMLNMFKIILTSGPVFTLESAACLSFLNHLTHTITYYEVSNPAYAMFIEYGFIVPLCKVLCIPIWICILKPLLSRYYPNMFKRMGIALIFFTASFVVYFVYDVLDYNNSDDLTYYYNTCLKNVTYVLNNNYIAVPSMYVSILQQLIYGWSQMLLYISTYEFICCQSPQYMKGLLFGLFYATRAFFQFVAANIVWFMIIEWNSTIMSCRSGYYLLNILIGVMTLILYTVAAKRYKYRKRDDICHVYKYAEDYYSNIQ